MRRSSSGRGAGSKGIRQQTTTNAASLRRRRVRDAVAVVTEMLEQRVMLNGVTYPLPDRVPGGEWPASVATADFDGDGHMDLVMANCLADTVSLAMNAGNGTFKPKVDITVAPWVTSVAAADMNGDGLVDIVTGNWGPWEIYGTVGVVLNNGGGEFAAPVIYRADGVPSSVIVADFNGDGAPDVAANPGTGGIKVLLNDGHGALGEPISYGTGQSSFSLPSPASACAADLNGDGSIDLVVANNEDQNLGLLFNHGDGTFAPEVDYATQGYPSAVDVADMNGDGRPDLVVDNWGTSSGLCVLTNNGDGTFADSVSYAPVAETVAIADLNGDGKPDVAAGVRGGTVSILLNNGDGTLSLGHQYGIADGVGGIAAADLDADGKTDLVIGSGYGYAATVLRNLGGGAFLHATTCYSTGYSASSIATADFNGDGKADLAVGNGESSLYRVATDPAGISVLLNDGSGAFPAVTTYDAALDPAEPGCTSVVAADLNGDGKPDLAGVLARRNVWILLNNGDGTFTAAGTFDTGSDALEVVAADFNGDGKLDLVVSHTSPGDGTHSVSVLMNNGDGTFGAESDYPLTYTGDLLFPQSIAAGDFNADGKSDLVTVGGIDTSGGVSVLMNNGDGTFGVETVYDAGGQASSVAVADFDGDGKPDLAVTSGISEGDSSLLIFLNDGHGGFSPRRDDASGVGGPVIAADLNGDGKPDLVQSCWFEHAASAMIYLNNGDGTFASATPYYMALGCRQVVAADLNSDGRPDLASVMSWPGEIAVLLSNPSVPVAGGPYTIREGDSLPLYASGAGSSSTYSWDVNGDGVFGDATGANPTLTWNQLKALGITDGPRTIDNLRVRVDDGHGNVLESDTATLVVNNKPPTLTLSGSPTVLQGQPYTLNLSVSDPGVDTITHWHILWGLQDEDEVAGNPSSLTHSFRRAGVCNITAQAWDEDGNYYSRQLSVTVIPLAPSNLTAVASSVSQIDLSWQDNSNSYLTLMLEQSTDGSTWNQVATLAQDSTSYSVTGLDMGTTYTFRVRVYDTYHTNCASDWSNTASATTCALEAPASPTATALSGNQIQVTWTDAANDESGYQIEQSTDGSTWSQVATVAPNTTSYAANGLTGSTTYSYRVRALTSQGYGEYTSSITATTPAVPAAPTDLAANAYSMSRIDLTWNVVSTTGTRLKLQQSTDGVTWRRIARLASDVTSYSVTGLTPGVTYSFRICAYDSNGSSAWSNTASAMSLPMRTPNRVQATLRSIDRVRVTWNDRADNESGYAIEQSIDGSDWTQVGTRPANRTRFAVTGVNPATRYYYRVRGWTDAGYSRYSRTATETMLLAPPPVAATTAATPVAGTSGTWFSEQRITAAESLGLAVSENLLALI